MNVIPTFRYAISFREYPSMSEYIRNAPRVRGALHGLGHRSCAECSGQFCKPRSGEERARVIPISSTSRIADRGYRSWGSSRVPALYSGGVCLSSIVELRVRTPTLFDVSHNRKGYKYIDYLVFYNALSQSEYFLFSNDDVCWTNSDY